MSSHVSIIKDRGEKNGVKIRYHRTRYRKQNKA